MSGLRARCASNFTSQSYGGQHAPELDSVIEFDKLGSEEVPTMVAATTTHISPIGDDAVTGHTRRARRSADYRAEWERTAPFEEVARLIISLRIRHDLTQDDLAQRVGTSVSAISRLESGEHAPNVRTLQRIIEATGERLVVGAEDESGNRELVAV